MSVVAPEPLSQTLNAYDELWLRASVPANLRAGQGALLQRCAELLKMPHCFDRSGRPGHFTGSALVLSSDLSHVLLTLHGKLNLWLQLGGHADGQNRLEDVALREAQEESGLIDVGFLPYEKIMGDVPGPIPFDLDIHWIPPNPKDDGHYHYDVRYILVAGPRLECVRSEESRDLRWFTRGEAATVTREPSMHRQFEKWDWLRRDFPRIEVASSSA
jgi:8-oxo-dGTP pyrophosphatase MutT (NUDIX family)